MKILSELVDKVLSTPEAAAYIRNMFVNRDLAIEIDGKRYQLTRKRNDDELENSKKELVELKSRLYDLETSLKNVLEVSRRKISGTPDIETRQTFEHADRLLGN